MTSAKDRARSAEKALGSLFRAEEFSEFVKRFDDRIRSSSVEAFREGTFGGMIAALERHGAFEDETFFAKLVAEKGKWFWPRWRIERLRRLYLPSAEQASRASRALFVALAVVLASAAVVVFVHVATQEPLPVVPPVPVEKKEPPPPEPAALPCGRGTEGMALITLPSGSLYVEISEVRGECYFKTDAEREEASRGVLLDAGVGECPTNGPAAFAADHPVVCVTPEEAKRYCEARERRLPSRREWIDAALHGSGDIMEKKPVGQFVGPDETRMNLCGTECSYDGPDKRAGSDDFPRTAPVRHFVVEGAQLLDMHGNVSEITTNGDKFFACGSSWSSYTANSIRLETCDDTRMAEFDRRHQAVGFRCVKDRRPASTSPSARSRSWRRGPRRTWRSSTSAGWRRRTRAPGRSWRSRRTARACRCGTKLCGRRPGRPPRSDHRAHLHRRPQRAPARRARAARRGR